MRQFFYLVISLTLISIALTSCLEEFDSDFTPEIYSSSFYVNPILSGDSIIGAADTLSVKYDATDNSFRLDTMQVGDTVLFSAVFYSFSDNLIAVKALWDSTRMDVSFTLNDEVRKVLTSQTNEQACQLYFNPGYNRVAIPIYAIPTKEGVIPMKLSVESDSQFSPKTITITFPAIN